MGHKKDQVQVISMAYDGLSHLTPALHMKPPPWAWSSCRGGRSNRQPQYTEPYHCVSGQPWVCQGSLQGQTQPFFVQQEWWGLFLGLRQGRAGGLWWALQFCRCVQVSRGGGSSRQPQRTEPCYCVSGQCWAYQGALQKQTQSLLCAAGVVGPALGAAAGPGW